MSGAYKCDGCGQFRTGDGFHVDWFPLEDELDHPNWREIDLCPVCGPVVLEPLAAIAATKHEDSA